MYIYLKILYKIKILYHIEKFYSILPQSQKLLDPRDSSPDVFNCVPSDVLLDETNLRKRNASRNLNFTMEDGILGSSFHS